MTCGVYLLKFPNTDKVYIGISENIERRWNTHVHNFKTGNLSNKLRDAYNKYGLPYLEVLCESNKEELDTLEKEAIQIFDSINNGFNSRDGGATGAGVSVSGDGNGMSKYSCEEIEKAFNLLVNSKLTQIEIAKTLNISKEVVSHISAGTGHTWLKNKYPKEYNTLVNTKRIVTNIFKPLNVLNINTNEVFTVSSYEEIQKLTGCAYSTAVCLVSGSRQIIFNTWKLENAIEINLTNKKPKYLLRHKYTHEECIVYSKLKFFTSKGLINRKKFSEFLKDGILGSEYQDWILVSIS